MQRLYNGCATPNVLDSIQRFIGRHPINNQKSKIKNPLAVSVGLIAVFLAGLLIWNYETVALMISNARAMNDGAEAARAMQTPDDLLAYLADHPEHVSLVVYDLDDPEAGLFYQADALRAVTGLTRLELLVAYTQRVADGRIDPLERVSVDTLSAYELPPLTVRDSSLTLEAVVQRMMRQSDRAAHDYLAARFESPEMNILPYAGLFLSWHASTPIEDPAYADTVWTWMRRYRDDIVFRSRMRERLNEEGMRLSLNRQRELAVATLPRRSANEVADRLRTAMSDPLFRQHFEQIVATDSLRTPFETVAARMDRMPGVVSFAGVARPRGDASPRLVVLLMDHVPTAIFYHLLRTGLDRGLVFQFFGDGSFLELARRRL